jgi:hypothetical protein
MNKKDLIDLGVAEEIADKVIVLHGKDIEGHKTRLTELQGQADAANAQLTEANTAIESFKAMKPDELKAAADDYKAKFEQAQADSERAISGLKFDHALESALTGAKAKNVKAVRALLSNDALKLNDDGSILGLKEQLEQIKSENDYLFADAKEIPKIVTGATSKPVIGEGNAALRKAAGLPVQTE